MGQTSAIMEALKKTLKAHGKTYADVAQALELSTASVKRLFSEEALSLKRLDTICSLIHLEMTDLIQQIAEQGWQLEMLDEEQEREIAADLILLLITVSVLNRLNLDEILSRFKFTEHVCIQKLAKLDRLKIIELLPKNRIKLRVASNFAWRPNGPIQRFFQEKLLREYFSSSFGKTSERMIVVNGILTDSSRDQFIRRLEVLVQEFEALNLADTPVPHDQRQGYTAVLAIRPWSYGLFAQFVRD